MAELDEREHRVEGIDLEALKQLVDQPPGRAVGELAEERSLQRRRPGHRRVLGALVIEQEGAVVPAPPRPEIRQRAGLALAVGVERLREHLAIDGDRLGRLDVGSEGRRVGGARVDDALNARESSVVEACARPAEAVGDLAEIAASTVPTLLGRPQLQSFLGSVQHLLIIGSDSCLDLERNVLVAAALVEIEGVLLTASASTTRRKVGPGGLLHDGAQDFLCFRHGCEAALVVFGGDRGRETSVVGVVDRSLAQFVIDRRDRNGTAVHAIVHLLRLLSCEPLVGVVDKPPVVRVKRRHDEVACDGEAIARRQRLPLQGLGNAVPGEVRARALEDDLVRLVAELALGDLTDGVVGAGQVRNKGRLVGDGGGFSGRRGAAADRLDVRDPDHVCG